MYAELNQSKEFRKRMLRCLIIADDIQKSVRRCYRNSIELRHPDDNSTWHCYLKRDTKERCAQVEQLCGELMESLRN